MPTAIPAKVLVDWTKLDNVDMQRKLLSSKQVQVATLPEQARIVLLSLPRKRLVDTTLFSDVEFVKSAVLACKDELERKWNLNHLYIIVSTHVVEDVTLPMIKRGTDCSFPLWFALADATILALRDSESFESLRYAAQRMDVACSKKFRTDVMVFRGGAIVKEQRIKLSLPSRGNCDDDQVKVVQEIETLMGIERPGDRDDQAYVNSW
jgi:hypothetical protein